MTTAAAIAHPLTRMALTVCRVLSFCAISRLRILFSWSVSFTDCPPRARQPRLVRSSARKLAYIAAAVDGRKFTSDNAIRSAAFGKRSELSTFNEAHSHSRGIADGLARQPLGAGPRPETAVVVGGIGLLTIAMRAPAIVIFGPCQFGAAAQLRAVGKSTGVIRRPAVAQ